VDEDSPIVKEIALGFVAAIVTLIVILALRRRAVDRRVAFVRQYSFPYYILEKIKSQYPTIPASHFDLVAAALRQYFLIAHSARNKVVPMPSKVVDALRHEFILDTREYTRFCAGAFGCFFNHTPTASSTSSGAASLSLEETMILACTEEGINPKHPSRLPILFAIDEITQIPGGNVYKLPMSLGRRTRGSQWVDSGCGGSACGGGGSDHGAEGSHSCGGDSGGGCGGD